MLDRNKIKALDAHSLAALANLRELRLEENGLRTLDHFAPLPKLQVLALGSNRILDVAELEKLGALPALQQIVLVNNPVARKQLYRPTLIRRLPSLKSIDGRELTLDERDRAELIFAADFRPAGPSSAFVQDQRYGTAKVPLKLTSMNFEMMSGLQMGGGPQIGGGAPLMGIGVGGGGSGHGAALGGFAEERRARRRRRLAAAERDARVAAAAGGARRRLLALVGEPPAPRERWGRRRLRLPARVERAAGVEHRPLRVQSAAPVGYLCAGSESKSHFPPLLVSPTHLPAPRITAHRSPPSFPPLRRVGRVVVDLSRPPLPASASPTGHRAPTGRRERWPARHPPPPPSPG